MTIMTKKHLEKIEEYYYWTGHKSWCPFPEKLKAMLMTAYGREPLPNSWSEQDIFEGSRKIISDYFKNDSN